MKEVSMVEYLDHKIIVSKTPSEYQAVIIKPDGTFAKVTQNGCICYTNAKYKGDCITLARHIIMLEEYV